MSTQKFFLGSNSPSGFYAYFDHLIDIDSAAAVYIVKGCPGRFQTTFMLRAASPLIEAGFEPEYIVSPLNPDSLDGIVFPELGAAFVDGTAPHVVEPLYPGLAESYVDLGRFCSNASLMQRRSEVMSTFRAYRAVFPEVYKCLSAASVIGNELFRCLYSEDSRSKTLKRTDGIIKREIKRGSRTGHDKVRFLSAVTHKGILFFNDTAAAICPKIFELYDTCGLSHFALSRIRDAALNAGHDVISCPCPMNPAAKLDHLLIPDLGIAFLTINDYLPSGSYEPYRRIHLDAYIGKDILTGSQKRIKFLEKTYTSLINDATEKLNEAKEICDVLESLYAPVMDVDGIAEYADNIGSELMKRLICRTGL
jgi:hypothetical protein